MIWTICFWTALGIIAAVLLTVTARSAVSRTKKQPFSVTKYLFFGDFAAVLVMVFPIYYYATVSDRFGLVKGIAFSLIQAVKLMGVNDISGIIGSIDRRIGLYPYYSTLMTILLFLAPVFTLSYILSFLKNARTAIKLFLSQSKEIYIFSALNDETLTLAGDIRKNHPKAEIVFADVSDEKNSKRYSDAAAINTLCIKKEITALRPGVKPKRIRISFFVLSDDIKRNTRIGLELITKYRDRENTRLYIAFDSYESELVLNCEDPGKITVRRIRCSNALVSNILYYNGKQIFAHAKEENGKKVISAVIVGTGNVGSEMLRNLSWYCQMDGFELNIDAFDSDPAALDRLSARVPELLDRHNGCHTVGEPYYSIRVHSGVKADTKSFFDAIEKIKPTYVFVALGSDEDNIKTAVDIRMICERAGIKPYINAVVYGSSHLTHMNRAKNFKGQPYDICFVGDIASRFSEKEILSPEIEELALAQYLKYSSDTDDFWKYEYHYCSSVATAIHQKAIVEQHMPGAGKTPDKRTPAEKKALAMLEHNRWVAYMRSQGYCYSGSVDRASRNDLAKIHNNIVPFDMLNEFEKKIDYNMTE